MKIGQNMDLRQLAERMGNIALREDAAPMRDVLVTTYYEDTDEIPAAEWLAMMNRALAKISRKGGLFN